MENGIRKQIEQMEENKDMSLLDEAFEDFTIINKSVVDDGYGGVITVWTDGAKISGAITYNNSQLHTIAQALGTTANYILTVRKNIDLDAFTVLRREEDGKTFRLLSNSDDNKTPKSAGLNMRQYQAEEFIIPN